MQKLTAILLDVFSQLSTIFLQENGILLLKWQSIYQTQMPIWNCIVYLMRQCSSVNGRYFNIMLSHGMYLGSGWMINADTGIAETSRMTYLGAVFSRRSSESISGEICRWPLLPPQKGGCGSSCPCPAGCRYQTPHPGRHDWCHVSAAARVSCE